MKVSTGVLQNRDRMPTIYDLERVTSIDINAPDEQAVRKQNASNIFEGWRGKFLTNTNKVILTWTLSKEI